MEMEMKALDTGRLTALHASLGVELRSHPLPAALNLCVTRMRRELAIEIVEVWVLSAGGAVLQLVERDGRARFRDVSPRLPIDAASPIASCARSARSEVHRLPSAALGDACERWMIEEGLTSHAVCPLLALDEHVGVLAIFARRALPDAMAADLPVLADSLAFALERRRWRDAQSRASSLLAGIGTLSPLALVSIDGDCRVDVWNPAAGALFGWRHDEVHGIGLPILPAGQAPSILELFEEVLRGDALHGEPVCKTRRDGTTVKLLIWTAPLADPSGHPAGCLAIFARCDAPLTTP
jgi:PAS domain S-box-containing protein